MSSSTQTINSLADWQRLLAYTFENIKQTRMQGVPVINSKLEVCAESFIHWSDFYLGVLVTPWFMNLLLAPANEETKNQFAEFKIGQKQTHAFPSGPYEFIVNNEPELGNYQSCSLFSPMFDFADQQAAMDTAKAVLKELMKEENLEVIDSGHEQSLHQPDGREPTNGQQTTHTDLQVDATEEPDQTPIIQKPISRRQLLMGGRK